MEKVLIQNGKVCGLRLNIDTPEVGKSIVGQKSEGSLLSIIVCQVFHLLLIVILKGFIYLFPISEDITQ